MSARTIQAQLAAATRHHPEDDHTDLRRDHAAAKLEQYIESVVAKAPPLTPEQRSRLSGLLSGGGA